MVARRKQPQYLGQKSYKYLKKRQLQSLGETIRSRKQFEEGRHKSFKDALDYVGLK